MSRSCAVSPFSSAAAAVLVAKSGHKSRFKKQYPGRAGSRTGETVKPGITVRLADTPLALSGILQEKKPMPCHSLSRMYGTVSADEQNEMSGLQFVQGLANRKLPLNTRARCRRC
jgi:hypothetical protein